MAQFDEFDLTYIQRVHDTRVTNVLTYQQTSADGTGNPREALANGWFLSTAQNNYEVMLGDRWRDLCAAVRQRNLDGQDYFRVESLPDVGDQSTTLNPATAVQLVMFPSNSGPGQQGSVYISGAPLPAEDRNNLQQMVYATWVLWAEMFLVPIVNTGWTFQLGLPSRPFIAAGPATRRTPPGQTALAFRPFVLADVRVPLTKIRSRRLNTRC